MDLVAALYCTTVSDNGLTLHFNIQTLHLIVQTLHWNVQTLHLIVQTLHWNVQTLHWNVQTLHFIVQTLHFNVQTLLLMAPPSPLTGKCSPYSTLATNAAPTLTFRVFVNQVLVWI